MAVRRSRSLVSVAVAVVVGTLTLQQLAGSSFLPGVNGRRASLLSLLGLAGSLSQPESASAVGGLSDGITLKANKVEDSKQMGQFDFDTSDVFKGIYKDPNHPGCPRKIGGATKAGMTVTGADGTPGCLEGEKKTLWSVTAVYTGGSDTLQFDFTKKGGPKNVAAKWDTDGLVFPDGNKWTKIGGYSFSGYR